MRADTMTGYLYEFDAYTGKNFIVYDNTDFAGTIYIYIYIYIYMNMYVYIQI